MNTKQLALLGALGGAAVIQAYDNGLAQTPQMGWNTWNYFGCSISEDTILSAAHRIVDLGLDKLGYEYVLMDDCWQAASRDPKTNAPRADPEKFPNGIKALSDEIHSLGLKIGIYSDAGTHTCGGRFGSLDYEEIDAKTYAEWEVDYLKYDNCYNSGRSGTPLISYERYANMSRALNATGRPILYSMCNWGEDGPWNWATTIANSWRISGDIVDAFDRYDDRCPCTSVIDCKLAGYHCAMTRIIDYAAPLGQKAGPGKWNDLDMLEVGNGGMDHDEYITHFSMWALLKSPMILGNNVIDMTNETYSIITNRAILDVNQDPLGTPATRIWRKTVDSDGGNIQLWSGPLVNGSTVVALMNTAAENQTINLQFADVFVDYNSTVKNSRYRLFDLWEKNGNTSASAWGADTGVYQGSVNGVVVGRHQTKVWKLVPESAAGVKRDEL